MEFLKGFLLGITLWFTAIVFVYVAAEIVKSVFLG